MPRWWPGWHLIWRGICGENLIPNSIGFLTKSIHCCCLHLRFSSATEWQLKSLSAYRTSSQVLLLLLLPSLSPQQNILSCQHFLLCPVSLISFFCYQPKKTCFKELMWLDGPIFPSGTFLILYFKIIFCIFQLSIIIFFSHIKRKKQMLVLE